MSKIASHNSFSYLCPRKWWMRLIRFTGKCQEVCIERQYHLGVRMFDIRLRFDRRGIPILCHGIMEYEVEDMYTDVFLTLFFNNMNKKGDCTCRIVLETKKPDKWQEKCFKVFCEYIEYRFTNITFVGGNNRTDWLCENPIYEFKTPFPKLVNTYASATSMWPNDTHFLRYVDDLYPKWYAKKHNTTNYLLGTPTNDHWLMLDFVNIK